MRYNQEDFDRMLAEIMNESPASHLLSVAGIYGIVADEFNNEVLQRLQDEREITNRPQPKGEGT